jgi:hypothetical protein
MNKKRVIGHNAIEAAALCGSVKLFTQEKPDANPREIDLLEAMEIALDHPEWIWANLDENKFENEINSWPDPVCKACGFNVFPPPFKRPSL